MSAVSVMFSSDLYCSKNDEPILINVVFVPSVVIQMIEANFFSYSWPVVFGMQCDKLCPLWHLFMSVQLIYCFLPIYIYGDVHKICFLT